MAKQERDRIIQTGHEDSTVADELRVTVQELEQKLALARGKINDLQAMLMAVSKQPDVPPEVLAGARQNIALGFDEGDAFEIAVRAFMLNSRQSSETTTTAKAS